jgi:hypothetical protein
LEARANQTPPLDVTLVDWRLTSLLVFALPLHVLSSCEGWDPSLVFGLLCLKSNQKVYVFTGGWLGSLLVSMNKNPQSRDNAPWIKE